MQNRSLAIYNLNTVSLYPTTVSWAERLRAIDNTFINRRQEANTMQSEAGKNGNKGTKLIMREPWDNEAN